MCEGLNLRRPPASMWFRERSSGSPPRPASQAHGDVWTFGRWNVADPATTTGLTSRSSVALQTHTPPPHRKAKALGDFKTNRHRKLGQKVTPKVTPNVASKRLPH